MMDSSLPGGLLWPFRATGDLCSPHILMPEGRAGNVGWGAALPSLEQELETFPQERRRLLTLLTGAVQGCSTLPLRVSGSTELQNPSCSTQGTWIPHCKSSREGKSLPFIPTSALEATPRGGFVAVNPLREAAGPESMA